MEKSKINFTALITLIAVIVSSCGNKADQFCDCLKKSANHYMVKGEKPKKSELWDLCSEYKGEFDKGDVEAKKKIEICEDTVWAHINRRELFTDVEDVKLEPITKTGAELNKEMSSIGKGYYYLNRAMKGMIVVKDFDLLQENITQKDNLDYTQVNGYYFDGNDIYSPETGKGTISIKIRIPVSEKSKIKESGYLRKLHSDIKNRYSDAYNANVYRQIIEFEGIVYKYENGLVIEPTTYTIKDPTSDLKASVEGYSLFEVSNGKDDNQNSNESVKESPVANESSTVESSNMEYFKVQDPDGYANMRTSPNGEVIKKVYSTEKFTVIGSEGKFKQIKLSDGTTGFIHESRVVSAQK